MGRLALVLALVTLALAWPASALAADGSLVNGEMIYTAGGGESNSVVFEESFAGEPTFRITDDPAVTITAQSPCFNGPTPNTMECPQDGNGSGAITILRASLGDGNDSITLLANLPTSIGAGGGDDVMKGGPADDFLRGGQNGDTITGGGGDDQLIGDDPDPTLGGGDDSLDGGEGNDTVDGEEGADTVTGGNGDDQLQGGGGNDLLLADGGADVIAGGDGVDTADYGARTQPQFLSLDGVQNDGEGTRADNILADVENAIGGSNTDEIIGSDSPNVLDGRAGDDRIDGGGGDDVLQGGDGNDAESGGDGQDNLAGGGGNDAQDGGPGDDTIGGGDGSDTQAGGDGADTLNGDAGDDSLDGGAGPDVMNGGDGVDTADYSQRTNGVAVALDGVPGDGELLENDNVQADVENVNGGSGPDTLLGSAAGNALDGGGGEDYSDGGPGPDTLTGGDSGDVLRTRGSGEADTITCGPGPDFVIAKPGDTIADDCDRADRGVRQRPKRRDSAVVAPVSRTLQMSPTGIVRRVPLQDRVVLPLRSIVDTVAGAVEVTTAPTARKRETIALEDGAFDIKQTRGRRSITQLALQGGDFGVCDAPAAETARAAVTGRRRKGRRARRGKTVRVLWAKGKGRFRTKGRYAAATIRGTRWKTVDTCGGTLIIVRSGRVAVRDLAKKRTVVVKAGDRYFAAAGRAARRR